MHLHVGGGVPQGVAAWRYFLLDVGGWTQEAKARNKSLAGYEEWWSGQGSDAASASTEERHRWNRERGRGIGGQGGGKGPSNEEVSLKENVRKTACALREKAVSARRTKLGLRPAIRSGC